MNQIEVTGMILISGPIGEHDRRVEILTKERGRISAFAKGARRQNSPLISVANPFVFGTFTLYVGRNSYTLQQAKIENYFGELRTDIEAAYYGMYFLEMAAYFTREGNDETQMLKLLYQSLRALMNPQIERSLTRTIFELKTMVIQGEGVESLTNFRERKLNESTFYAIQYIRNSTIEKLYSFTLKPDVFAELEKLTKEYLSISIDKKFHTLEFLELL